jgi:CubicO group peptidase (beta-lactamase class C family)
VDTCAGTRRGRLGEDRRCRPWELEGSPGEVGAACCVSVDGRPVVDPWGGLADGGGNRPWDEDTITSVASTTKGATALCAHLPAHRGSSTWTPR